jgi:hypothetical protein
VAVVVAALLVRLEKRRELAALAVVAMVQQEALRLLAQPILAAVVVEQVKMALTVQVVLVALVLSSCLTLALLASQAAQLRLQVVIPSTRSQRLAL